MGKIDDMRRLREQQFAETETRRANAAKARPAVVDAPAAPKAVPVPGAATEPSPTPRARPAPGKKRTSATTGDPGAEQGKCPVCGKTKPVQSGVMASHQKGFGKACAGSRQKPV